MTPSLTRPLFRPLPITTLTIRQFMGGRAIWVTALISLIPALFALVYLIDPGGTTRYDFFARSIFLDVFSPTILPIATLILATAALGNELEDRSLPYLTLKPISRTRIVVEKFFGVLITAIPAILLGVLVTYGILAIADEPTRLAGRIALANPLEALGPALLSTIAGVITFTALFMMVSLYIPRALLAGIIYIFLWESLLGRYLPGIRVVSVRHYVQSLFTRFLGEPPAAVPPITIEDPFQIQSALLVLGVTTIVSLAIAIRRLRRLDIE
jgi:ABC-2 type transport system permease protein